MYCRISHLAVFMIMEITDFTKYDNARVGIFLQDANEYELPIGWKYKKVQKTIIGETQDLYVTRLQEFEYGEWHGDEVIKYKHTLPIGYSKDRLSVWLPVQLQIFS